MLNHLGLFFHSIAGKMFSRIFSKKGEVITETKKCMNCLRRIKISYDRCPHCRSDDFAFDAD